MTKPYANVEPIWDCVVEGNVWPLLPDGSKK